MLCIFIIKWVPRRSWYISFSHWCGLIVVAPSWSEFLSLILLSPMLFNKMSSMLVLVLRLTVRGGSGSEDASTSPSFARPLLPTLLPVPCSCPLPAPARAHPKKYVCHKEGGEVCFSDGGCVLGRCRQCSGNYEAQGASGGKYKAQIVIFCILAAVDRFSRKFRKAESSWGKSESHWGKLESRWRKLESRWRKQKAVEESGKPLKKAESRLGKIGFRLRKIKF